MESSLKYMLSEGWFKQLKPFLKTEAFQNIRAELLRQKEDGVKISPSFDDMFNAFHYCPFEELKVVFVTANSYLQGQSDGLAFSSRLDPYKLPPVLSKILDGMEADICDGLYLEMNGDLTRWAEQGVLLLNLDLTTIRDTKRGHMDLWKPFMKATRDILLKVPGLIFVLVGKEAQKFGKVIDRTTNDVYELEHPQLAVIQKRNWEHKNVFTFINRATSVIHNSEIKWR